MLMAAGLEVCDLKVLSNPMILCGKLHLRDKRFCKTSAENTIQVIFILDWTNSSILNGLCFFSRVWGEQKERDTIT